MRLLITPNIGQFSDHRQKSAQVCLEQLLYFLKAAPIRKKDQFIELQSGCIIQNQINSALDNLDIDIDILLDPGMPNFGGMEVMATIKRDLSLEIETMLAIESN